MFRIQNIRVDCNPIAHRSKDKWICIAISKTLSEKEEAFVMTISPFSTMLFSLSESKDIVYAWFIYFTPDSFE